MDSLPSAQTSSDLDITLRPPTVDVDIDPVLTPRSISADTLDDTILGSEHDVQQPVVQSNVSSSPVLKSANVVSQSSEQAKLALDLGEFFLNSRLLEEKFRRCPGQKYTPRDMNCGPRALLHQLCTNPAYESTQLYSEEDHGTFRSMVSHHFLLQVFHSPLRKFRVC